ncbi:MAG TPA: hypothetical protein VGJ95_03290 [Pseudonocardiaceae bacterium]|jgi:hypothetical protein
MTRTSFTALCHRDRVVLKAVAAGRCHIAAEVGVVLTIDGMGCCDQLVGARLSQAGLIAIDGARPGPARLTAAGRAVLDAA